MASLSQGVPATVTAPHNPGYACKYWDTLGARGVFMDVAPIYLEPGSNPNSANNSHVGVAFFCNLVPSTSPDNKPWGGVASGVIFYGNGAIHLENWLGGSNNAYVSPSPIGYWSPGIVYRVTALRNADNSVTLAVYSTNSAGAVTALVASATGAAAPGNHACVLATQGNGTQGGSVGCCPNSLHF